MKIQNFEKFSLEEVRVEPARNIIVADGQSCRVEPRLMAVLVRLRAANGEVVSRDTLIEDVWGDDEPNDEALTQTISRLRRVIGDDPKQPRIIETVPKRGYRLMIAPAKGVEETSVTAGAIVGRESNAKQSFSAGWKNFKPAFTQVQLLWAALIIIGGVVLYSTVNKPETERYEVELYLQP